MSRPPSESGARAERIAIFALCTSFARPKNPPFLTYLGRLLCLHSLAKNYSLSAEYLKANYSGSILFLSSSQILDGDFPPFYALSHKEANLLDVVSQLKLGGILIYNTAARVGSTSEILLVDQSWCRSLSITTLETGLTSGLELVKMCETVTPDSNISVTLNTGDRNDWMTIKRGAYIVIFRIVATLAAVAAGSLAGAKLIGYVRVEGFRLNIPQVTLWVQLVAALFRAPVVAIDPIYSGLYMNATGLHMTSTVREEIRATFSTPSLTPHAI